jgi:anti-sigma regulatory factor (Ser/Thr protein kinase)
VELSAKLAPGSTIVLYTDGLVEERGVSIDQGLDALRMAAAQDVCHPEELCDRLRDAMLAIHPANDDIAILALRALPTAPPPLHLEIPSDPNQLGRMRRELGSWLRMAGASSEVVEVVQMACHEACSNSIEHGYSFGDGKLSVDAELDQRVVVLTIRDEGGWVERPDGNLPYRGNGLPLMEALMDSVELTHENGDGTAVRMARSLVSERVPVEA